MVLTKTSHTQYKTIPAKELVHGAIYTLAETDILSKEVTTRDARCNISVDGDEVWFTDLSNKSVGGTPFVKVADNDERYPHNDVVK